MKNRFFIWFKNCLSREIMIEYKVCLYFACILFFYFIWLLCQGIYLASVLFMFEMVFAAYFIVYIQVYIFRNFDEAERLERRDLCGIAFCAVLYGVISWLLNWFDRNLMTSLLFAVFMIIVYMCVFLLNKLKRAIDTNNLNKMLTEFKKGEGAGKNEHRE